MLRVPKLESINLNQFYTQDKTRHTLLEIQKTFDQFGKRTETLLPLSAEKTNRSIASFINFINQENIVFVAFKKRSIPNVADSVIGLILLRIVSCSWFNGLDTSSTFTVAKPSSAG